MQLEPVILGFKFNIRVSHLAPEHVVEMVCARCEHRHMVAPWQLHARFPPSIHLKDAVRHFRCRRCPARGAARWTIYRAVSPLSEVERRG